MAAQLTSLEPSFTAGLDEPSTFSAGGRRQRLIENASHILRRRETRYRRLSLLPTMDGRRSAAEAARSVGADPAPRQLCPPADLAAGLLMQSLLYLRTVARQLSVESGRCL